MTQANNNAPADKAVASAASAASAKEVALKKQNTMRMVRALLPIAGLVIIFALFSYLTNGRLITRLPLAMSTAIVSVDPSGMTRKALSLPD